MAKQDFYETLGVPRGATPDEIKKAYRTLARKYHPDVNKEPDAQKRFTAVQEAYDVLSDEKRRAAYDRHGHAAFDAGAAAGGPHYSWSNVGEPGGSVRAEDISDLSELFESFFGGRRESARAGSRQTRPRRHTPEPAVHDLTIDFETAARGGTVSLQVSGGRAKKQIDVKIPRGVASGAKLRVPAAATGDGDLLIRLTVRPHPLWRRRGDAKSPDLEMDLPLNLTEAIFGTRVEVPTLDGTVDLTVPPGAGGGKALRVKGRGLAPAGDDDDAPRGDLFVIPRVVPPAAGDLTKEARSALEKLRDKLPSPRTGPGWGG